MRKNKQDNNEIINQYLAELRNEKYEPIPFEIETQLVKDAQAGDEQAIKQLVESHLRLVVNVAKRYANMGIEIEDLIQEGNIGLYRAALKFQQKGETRFCAYAIWWIKKTMRDAVYNRVNIDDNELTLINKNEDDSKAYEDDEIFYEANQKDENNQSFEDIHNDVETQEEYKDTCLMLLNNLDERQRYIIESYYGINNAEQLSLVEIAENLGISTERIRQLKSRAMMSLRSHALLHNVAAM